MLDFKQLMMVQYIAFCKAGLCHCLATVPASDYRDPDELFGNLGNLCTCQSGTSYSISGVPFIPISGM